MKTVIVTPEILGPYKQGGIGTYCSHLAWLLRQAGENVTIIYTGVMHSPREVWEHLYAGIEVRHVREDAAPLPYEHHGYSERVRRAELVTAAMPPDADIVYFHDWEANGFHFLRSRQYRATRLPVCVTIINSPLQWMYEANEVFPARQAVQDGFTERYSVAQSDVIIFASTIMRDYVTRRGWTLPPDTALLRNPLLPTGTQAAPPPPAGQFRRVIFYGRLATGKGIEVFVDALALLGREKLAGIEEIVLLGGWGGNRFESIEALVQTVQAAVAPIRVTSLSTYDVFAAERYLTDHAADSLLVAPALLDNLPYAVLQASLIPGLNVIHSVGSGAAEVLDNPDQLFKPNPRALAQHLTTWLARPPRPHNELAHYDFERYNAEWLAFHADLKTRVEQTRTPRPLHPVRHTPALDVCVTYFNLPDTLPVTLQALERQTSTDFALWVVNDASTDARANAVFAEMKQKYANRAHWHFVELGENLGLSAARNAATRMGQADYLLFHDADNIAAPNMIERFMTAMRLSDYDALSCNVWLFEGDDTPFLQPKPPLTPYSLYPKVYYAPLGDCRELDLVFNTLGDANFCVKRSVFEALGGFNTELPTHQINVSSEDWEFLLKLVIAGYRMDVIPETLLYYRVRAGSVSRTHSYYSNNLRALTVYMAEMQKIGLQHLAPWVNQLVLQTYELEAVRKEYASLQADPVAYSTWRFDPKWLATYISWRTLVAALWRKLTKRL